LLKAQFIALLLAHSFYDQDCCQDQHCHPVPCEQIEAMTWGWIWHPLGQAAIGFNRDSFKPSPDGNCHVCVNNMTASPALNGICIYLPPRV
jgi:hypothetical protein